MVGSIWFCLQLQVLKGNTVSAKKQLNDCQLKATGKVHCRQEVNENKYIQTETSTGTLVKPKGSFV